jgi:hypothetical protein
MPDRPHPPRDRDYRYPGFDSSDYVYITVMVILCALIIGGVMAAGYMAHSKSTQISSCKPDFIMIKDAFGKMACVRGYNVEKPS